MSNGHTFVRYHQVSQEGRKSRSREDDVWHKPRRGWLSGNRWLRGECETGLLNAHFLDLNAAQVGPTGCVILRLASVSTACCRDACGITRVEHGQVAGGYMNDTGWGEHGRHTLIPAGTRVNPTHLELQNR